MVEPSNEPTPEPQEFGDLTEIFEKVHRRINEDNASLYADLCEALAITDRQQHRHLVESFVVARSDVFAYYHVFLVPGLLPIEGYRELLEIIQRQAEETLTQQCRLSLSLNFQLRIKAMAARWDANAMERARTWQPPSGTTEAAQLLTQRTPESVINEWMKANDVSNAEAAKQLAISETVLYALKRGTAVKDHRCGLHTLLKVATKIGCRPDELESEYTA